MFRNCIQPQFKGMTWRASKPTQPTCEGGHCNCCVGCQGWHHAGNVPTAQATSHSDQGIGLAHAAAFASTAAAFASMDGHSSWLSFTLRHERLSRRLHHVLLLHDWLCKWCRVAARWCQPGNPTPIGIAAMCVLPPATHLFVVVAHSVVPTAVTAAAESKSTNTSQHGVGLNG